MFVAGTFVLMKSGSTSWGETTNFTFVLAQSPAICFRSDFQTQRENTKYSQLDGDSWWEKRIIVRQRPLVTDREVSQIHYIISNMDASRLVGILISDSPALFPLGGNRFLSHIVISTCSWTRELYRPTSK